MSRYIPQETRTQVAERAFFRCEYCLLPDDAGSFPFEVDHVIAIKHGGKSIFENLAYACPRCNRNKGTDLTTVLDDPETPIRIFNPRRDIWEEHFEVESGGIYPKTLLGEATVKILNLNDPDRVIGRRLLAESGLYP